jgi:hypothetical protein
MQLTVQGMTVLVQRSGEILLLTMLGVITIRGVCGARKAVADLLKQQDARAVVVDLRRVIPLLSADGWRELTSCACLTEQIAPPVAVVVAPRYEQRLREYCLAMAERGFVRGPFTGLHGAIEWAAKRQEHWAWRPAAPAPSSADSQTPLPAQTPHALPPASPAADRPSLAQS